MKEAFIVSIETQSPSIKLLRLKTNTPFSKKDAGGLFFNPGQSIKIKAWGYGKSTFPIASSPYESRFLEIFTKRGDILSEALHQLSSKEPAFIDQPNGNGFPIKELANKDVVLIADNSGIGAVYSFLPYLSKNKGQFGNITIVYLAPEQAEILSKDKLKEFQEKLAFIIKLGTPNANFNDRIEYNPLKTKVVLCISGNIKQTLLDFYIKPLGISYKDVFVWNSEETKQLLK